MFESPLQKAIRIAGGQDKLGKRFGKGQYLVSTWVVRNGGRVSADFVLKVSEAVEWQVTPHELRPDLYPHPQDGLPEHLREVA